MCVGGAPVIVYYVRINTNLIGYSISCHGNPADVCYYRCRGMKVNKRGVLFSNAGGVLAGLEIVWGENCLAREEESGGAHTHACIARE